MHQVNTDNGVFLNKLKWMTHTQEFKDMDIICVDCYKFKFEQPLSKDIQYQFVEYMETLDLTHEHAILCMGIWLYQHDVSYKLSFKWDRTIPFCFNLQRLRRPKLLYRHLESNKERFMTINLAACTCQPT